MKKLFFILSFCFLVTGCSQRLGDFTVASTSNINLNEGEFVTGKRITGQDLIPIVVFPIGVPNLENAVEDAVYSEENNCIVGLENVTMRHKFFSFIFGFVSYEVEGNAIYDVARPNCSQYMN